MDENILRVTLSLYLCIFSPVNTFVTVNTVYYEMPPFIHRNGNGTLIGIIPDIAMKIWELCSTKLQFAVDVKSEKNFTSLLENPKLITEYTGSEREWIWLSLLQRFPTETLMELSLAEYHLFQSPGLEVLVHRDQIGIFSKVLVGLNRCEYLFLMITLLAMIFGI